MGDKLIYVFFMQSCDFRERPNETPEIPFDNQLKGIVTPLSKVLKKKNPQPLNFNSHEIKL